jgi:hypothetical protein
MAASIERKRAVVLYPKMFNIKNCVVKTYPTKEAKSPAEIKKKTLDAMYRESSLSCSRVNDLINSFA